MRTTYSAHARITTNTRIFLVSLFLVFVSGCATTKVDKMNTGFNTSELESDEAILWRHADDLEAYENRFLAGYDFFQLNKYLNEVLHKVDTEKLTDQKLSARVRVTPDLDPNIGTLPNGAVYISTGMLAWVENEAQLAFLLAHELGHYKLRHGLKEARNKRNQRKRADVFGVWLGFLGANRNQIYNRGVASGSSELWEIMGTLSYEVDLEYEADRFALASIVAAGYDYSEARWFLVETREKIAVEALHYGEDPEEDFRVVVLEERIEELDKSLAAAATAAVGVVGEQAYLSRILSALEYNVLENIFQGDVLQAESDLENYLKGMPDSATTHYLKGRVSSAMYPENPYRALAWYQKSIGLDSDHADTLLHLGYVYQELNNDEQSKFYFEKYLEIKPYAAEAGAIRSMLAEATE